MFESLGFGEMLMIAAIALIVLGPEKFPGHAKVALRFMRDIRNYWDEAKRDLAEELKPLKTELRELEKYRAEDYLSALTEDKPNEAGANGETGSAAAPATTESQPTPTVGRSELTPWQPVEGVEPFTEHSGSQAEPVTAKEPDYVDKPAPEGKHEEPTPKD